MSGWARGVQILGLLAAGTAAFTGAFAQSLKEQTQTHSAVQPTLESPISEQEAKSLELLDDIEKRTQFRFDSLLRQARLNATIHERDKAEAFYLDALRLKVPEDQRKAVHLELASFYLEDERLGLEGAKAKRLSVYETLLAEFPKIEEASEVYLRLGQLYRDLGDPRQGLLNFYNVLNASLIIPKEHIEFYKKWSLLARIEIANTHFQLGEFEEARNFYRRLNVLEMNEADRKYLRFKAAYADYQLKDLGSATLGFESFIKDYPASNLTPEAYFTLALIYEDQDNPQKSLEYVLELLGKKPDFKEGSDQKQAILSHWHYWKKRSGNYLANHFYENADYGRALQLYQAMVPAQETLNWQVPLFYQIGLCFEKLKMAPKAQDAYMLVLETLAKEKDSPLTYYQDACNERLKHLNWAKDVNAKLDTLFD